MAAKVCRFWPFGPDLTGDQGMKKLFVSRYVYESGVVSDWVGLLVMNEFGDMWRCRYGYPGRHKVKLIQVPVPIDALNSC